MSTSEPTMLVCGQPYTPPAEGDAGGRLMAETIRRLCARQAETDREADRLRAEIASLQEIAGRVVGYASPTALGLGSRGFRRAMLDLAAVSDRRLRWPRRHRSGGGA